MSAVLNPPDLPASSPTAPLMTGEAFFATYGHRHAELVRGRVKETPMPSYRHGEVCVRAIRYFDRFVDDGKIGRVCSNDSLFYTRRDPDTARGPDVSYLSFDRMPPGPAPEGISTIVPELAVEIRSPNNTWKDIHAKIGEYLTVGVVAVLVLGPEKRAATVYRDDGQTSFAANDTLTLPDVLPGFEIEVAKFFE